MTGADGLLGHDLVPALQRASHTVLPMIGGKPDITSFHEIREAIHRFKPDCVFHLAAFTLVDECQEKRELAHQVNAVGAGNVARASRESDALVVMISTDYIFDGRSQRPYREDDPPAPLSVYGKSKLDGEVLVKEGNPRHLIVRTSWLYGHGGRCFPKAILQRVRTRQPLRVVSDQRGAPTWARDLSTGLLKLVSTGATGTFHCTAGDECSWYDFALHIVHRSGTRATVEPIDSETFGAAAPRPEYSVLDNRKFEHATGYRLPDWMQSADEFLDQEMSA